jgi:hypothetical protein
MVVPAVNPRDDESWAEYNRTIDRMLDEDRPTRSINADRDWMERTKGWARNHIPNETGIVRYFADKEVERREGRATKAGNDVVRVWMKGQAPLDWGIDGRKPIKLRDGTRVRLDAATPADVWDAARTLARQLKTTYDNGMVAARGLWLLGAEADRQGLDLVMWLGPLAPGAAEEWDVDASELDWSEGEGEDEDEDD